MQPRAQPQQPATESPLGRAILKLSAIQEHALQLLLQGVPETTAARIVGLNRSTLYRWRTFHPVFAAELNRLRLERWQSLHQRVRHLLPKAMKAIHRSLDHQDPHVALRAATALLAHAVPAHDHLAPPATNTSPHEVIESFARLARRNSTKDPEGPITQKERDSMLLYLFE